MEEKKHRFTLHTWYLKSLVSVPKKLKELKLQKKKILDFNSSSFLWFCFKISF